MRQTKGVGFSIAEIPFHINTDNAYNLSYIKSILKDYLKPIEKPNFNIHINTPPLKKEFSQSDSIELIPQGSRFILFNKNKRNIKQELGFIDKKNRFCQLNIRQNMIKTLFYPLLMSAFSQFLSDFDGFIIHSSGLVYQGHAYIFPGPSGSGKSTVAFMLKKRGFNIISEEKIIIRRIDYSFVAYAAPWLMDRNQCAPLKNIIFLRKGNKVHFRPLRPSYAISQMLSNIIYLSLPNQVAGQRILSALCLLCKRVSSYEMEFTLNDLFWHKLRDLN